MNTINRILFIGLIPSLASLSGFSQDSSATKTTVIKEESRPDGLKKISGGHPREWDFDIKIDHEALEKNIETAVENAMKSVDVALEKLEINIEPIEINLQDLNMAVDPVIVNIPNINIDIDPIEVNVPDLDIKHDHFHWKDAEDTDDDKEVGVDGDEHDHSFQKGDSHDHDNVGAIECQTCHGQIEEMEVVKQYSLLTMGWCIDCHRKTNVNNEGNAYYDKLLQVHEASKGKGSKMKVEDIGGLECSKCHY